MKKIAWILLLLTIVTWLAIAIYWTGNTDSKVETPEKNQVIVIPKESKPSTSSSTTPTPLVESITATESTILRY